MPDAAAKNASHTPDWGFTLVVSLLGLLPRLYVAIAWSREPVWDGHYYHFGATRIAEGLGYSEDVIVGGQAVWKAWCHYPVGYSAFLGLLYLVFGRGLLVAPIANAAIGALQIAVGHRLGRCFLSTNRARVAAALIALHPGLIAYSAVVMTELLTALLLSWAALIIYSRRGQLKGAAYGGIMLGLATLVRPSVLLAAPLSALLHDGKRWRALALAAVSLAVTFAVVMPWTIRNCNRMDGCAFVSTNGGWNLAIGALTDSGRFRTLKAQDGCPVVTGQVQQDRCWAKVGREAILKDPKRWISLMPKKLGHTYDHESFAIEYLREANPNAWPEHRRVAGRNLLSHFHRGLLILAAFSVVGLPLSDRRRNPQRDSKELSNQATLAWVVQAMLFSVLLGLAGYAIFNDEHPFFWLPTLIPLLVLLPVPGRPLHGGVGRYAFGLLFSTTLIHAVFFGDDRYHLVVTPVLCLLGAAAFRRSRPLIARTSAGVEPQPTPPEAGAAPNLG
ncbi:MAG: glycosyltransferase family 39 protein [Myxococcales bacterium]|nr:glycosyltransferase family 39 protein [Myxococcales bacterium]